MNSFITIVSVLLLTSIYTLQFNASNGTSTSMSSFQGKKILIVNIATGSSRVDQLGQLQELQNQFSDSLVILGFPSNSFGNENRSNADIRQFCQTTYGVTFLLAEKNPVISTPIQSIYNWLSKQSENGEMNGIVVGDFQKFLVDKSGALVGVFAPSVLPTDTLLIKAIRAN